MCPHEVRPRCAAECVSVSILASLLSISACACSAPADDNSTWREVSTAEPSAPVSPGSRTTSSLGDPFVLVAGDTDNRLLLQEDPPASPRAESVWLMMRSDACDLELTSMSLAARAEDGSPKWVTTAEAANGVVTEASSGHAAVRFDLTVRVSRDDGGWVGGMDRPATLDVRLTQLGQRVELAGEIRTRDGELHVPFSVAGDFEQDPTSIPERRLACPHR